MPGCAKVTTITIQVCPSFYSRAKRFAMCETLEGGRKGINAQRGHTLRRTFVTSTVHCIRNWLSFGEVRSSANEE